MDTVKDKQVQTVERYLSLLRRRPLDREEQENLKQIGMELLDTIKEQQADLVGERNTSKQWQHIADNLMDANAKLSTEFKELKKEAEALTRYIEGTKGGPHAFIASPLSSSPEDCACQLCQLSQRLRGVLEGREEK